jgi:hypothetical protein
MESNYILKILQLHNCTDLKELPNMPRVKSLKLLQCAPFTTIPPLPSLEELEMDRCTAVSHISLFPGLKNVGIHCCSNLVDILCTAKLHSFHMCYCSRITIDNISSLLQTPTLHLTSFVFTSLNGIEGKDDKKFAEEKRNLSISGFPSLNDFSFCKNICKVTLSVLDGLISCENIMNIHHLKIYYCRNLTSSKGLKNITGSVTFHSCETLSSINDLQNIPVVEIEYCAMSPISAD